MDDGCGCVSRVLSINKIGYLVWVCSCVIVQGYCIYYEWRLTEMVDHTDILTQEQGGFRQNKYIDINTCKLYGLTKEVQRLNQHGF